MNLIGDIIRKVLKLDEAAKIFEEKILIPGLRVKNLPATSKYYEAYYVGFLHGGLAEKEKKIIAPVRLIEIIISEKKKKEQQMAHEVYDKTKK